MAIQELKKNEEKIELIFSNMKDPILVISHKNMVLFANENALEEFGESLVGKKCYKTLFKSSKSCKFCPIEEFLTREQSNKRFEKTVKIPSGKAIKHFEINASFVDNFYGNPAIIEVFRDITERRKAKEKVIRNTAIMNTINEIFYKALTCETVEELGQLCLEVAQNLSGAKFGFFGEVNKVGKFDTIAISNPGWEACKMPDSNAIKIIKGMEIRGMQFLPLKDGSSRIFNDPSNHPDSVGTPEGHPEITCLLAVPFIYKGEIIGQIGLGNKEGGFDHHDQEAIEAISIAMIEALMRKRTEVALKESEKKFRDLFENSPNSIILLNMKGIIIDCNVVTEKIFGYKKEELINKSYYETPIVPSSSLSIKKEKYREIYNGNAPKPVEIQINRKDGNLIWVNIQSSLFKMGTENYVQLIIQDVTAKKKAEKELEKIEKTLQEIDGLIETAPLGILLLNNEGKILKANIESENLFDFNREKIIGNNIYDFFDTKFIDIVKKHYKTNIYDLSIPNKIEVLLRTKRGKLLYVEVTSTILRIEDHLIIQSFFSDITERKNYEKNRQLLFDQSLNSLEFKSKFMANISHELRTPLNAILGFSQLLLDSSYGILSEDQKDFLHDINFAGNHLLTLINTILDLSKIEAGKLELNLEEFELKNIMDEINSVIKPLYNKKNLKYMVKSINDHDFLIADPLRFKQIIYNLLSNAIKFTNNGTIKLQGIERIDHWEFRIKDTGIGISKNNYDVVFREFGRIENDRTMAIQGTGLGLALTKRLINLHGGEIWFQSEVDKGTTFFFTIPKIDISNT